MRIHTVRDALTVANRRRSYVTIYRVGEDVYPGWSIHSDRDSAFDTVKRHLATIHELTGRIALGGVLEVELAPHTANDGARQPFEFIMTANGLKRYSGEDLPGEDEPRTPTPSVDTPSVDTPSADALSADALSADAREAAEVHGDPEPDESTELTTTSGDALDDEPW